MALQKGMAAVKASIERSQSGSGPRTYEQTNWFTWRAGEAKPLRFLTDSNDIFVVPVHEQVPTHDGKKTTFVCRTAFDASCELCAREKGTPGAYRRDVGYGVAVLREEVKEDGKTTGYRDVTTEYEEVVDGKNVMKKKPYVGIVSQGMRNFWNQIAVISEKYGSLRDREIEILRQGQGTDTTYMAFALPEKEIANIDERYSKFVPDLEAYLKRIGSAEYYDAKLRGIVKEKTENKSYSSNTGSTAPASSSSFGDDEYGDDEYVSIEEETTAERLQRKLAAQQ